MKIKLKNILRIDDSSISEICSYYKNIGITDQRIAYDNYLIDTGLKPSVDAKEFHIFFNSAKREKSSYYIEFTPNIIDLLKCMLVDAKRDRVTKIWYLTWEDGTVGSYPPNEPPDPIRFVPISWGCK